MKSHKINDETIYSFMSDDKEMNTAIKKAIQSLDEFDKALKSDNPDFKKFALKVRFQTDSGSEHIWVSEIKKDSNSYSGVIDNLPEAVKDLKTGDTIKIKNNTISDWIFLDKNKLRGGYTYKVIRKRLNEVERKQMDKEMKFIIDE